MNLTQGQLSQGLFDEICDLIEKYDETLYLSTVLGVIEMVKVQVINDHMEDDEDEE